MRWSDIPFNASERMLRQFAALSAVALAAAGLGYGWTRGWPTWTWLALVGAAAVAAVGWLAPRWLRPVFVGWMILVFPLGWLMSQVMLLAMFFGLFLPVALIFRLLGRDPLALKRKPSESYWRVKPRPTDPRRYFRQY